MDHRVPDPRIRHAWQDADYPDRDSAAAAYWDVAGLRYLLMTTDHTRVITASHKLPPGCVMDGATLGAMDNEARKKGYRLVREDIAWWRYPEVMRVFDAETVRDV